MAKCDTIEPAANRDQQVDANDEPSTATEAVFDSSAQISPTQSHFWSLAPDTRHKIFKMCIGMLKDNEIRIAYNQHPKRHPRFDRGYGGQRPIVLGIGRWKYLFLVSRQFREEAAEALFGSIRFYSFNMRGFRNSFLSKIQGFSNLIQHIVFGVPESVKNDPNEKVLGTSSMLPMLVHELPRLMELQLTTKFNVSDDHKFEVGGHVPQEVKSRRSLLHLAAYITLHHPRLEQAILVSSQGTRIRMALNAPL